MFSKVYLKSHKWKIKSNNNKIEAEDLLTRLRSFWPSLQKLENYISEEVQCIAPVRWVVGYSALKVPLADPR